MAGLEEVPGTCEGLNRVGDQAAGTGAVSQGFVTLNPGRVKVVAAAPISRPLGPITRGAPTPDVQKLIDFFRSESGQRFLR